MLENNAKESVKPNLFIVGTVGFYKFLISLNPKSLAVGLIVGWLIIPSPMALLFPKPIQQALKNVSCGVNEVYQRLGI
jgi:hypothetical protein